MAEALSNLLQRVIPSEKHWMKGEMFANDQGRSVDYTIATRFCLGGAVAKVAMHTYGSDKASAERYTLLACEALWKTIQRLYPEKAKQVTSEPAGVEWLVPNFNDDKEVTFEMVQNIIKKVDFTNPPTAIKSAA